MNSFPQGLVPAIVQDAANGKVLMLAYMNEEAYSLTLQTDEVHFYSRSRHRLWKKGATSGNVLRLEELRWDCDYDTILIKAWPQGPTCHTGEESCFHHLVLGKAQVAPMDIVARLTKRLAAKTNSASPRSYSRELMCGSLNQCAKKVIEEAGELALAAASGRKEEVVYEAADLLFHALALLTRTGARVDEVLSELAKRWKDEQR